eukprot:3949047-Pyramimonas_sp.AAC.1
MSCRMERVDILWALVLQGQSGSDIALRFAAGWSTFWAWKRLLSKTHVALKEFLRLFKSTVTGRFFWRAESWAPRAEEFWILKATRHPTLRGLLRCGRGDQEYWVAWIQKSSRQIRQLARNSWVLET